MTATGAAYEGDRGRAGFLPVIDPGRPEEPRYGRVTTVPGTLYNLCGVRTMYVAQLEPLAVLVAFTDMAEFIRGTSSVWFIDKVAALMNLVKRSSCSRSLDQIAKLVHLACFSVRLVPSFEMESGANWASSMSRHGAQGSWAPRNDFPVAKCSVVVELLTLPCLAVIRIFDYW